MPKINSIKFNFMMNSFLTASSIIFPLITFPYVSRVLGPIGLGKVSFALSITSYYSMFAQLGIPTYGIRTCAKIRDNKEELTRTVQEIMIINLVMCFIVYIAFLISLTFISKFRIDTSLFVILSLSIIFNALGVEWLYKSLEQYKYIAIRSIVFKIIALIAMFLMVRKQSDYIVYGGLSILAAVGSNIFNFVNLRNLIYVTPISNYQFKRHLKPITIFFAMSVATTIYTHLDTVMLGFMKSDSDVGYYNAAVKIKGLLVNFVASLGTVLLPRVSYYIESGLREEFVKLTKKALNFVVLLAIPLMIYFIIFAKQSILCIAGKNYTNSITPMIIIMPTILFIGLTNIIGIQILVPLGREKVVLTSEIIGAIFNIIINILLIPKLVSSGAAIGTLVAELMVFVVQCYSLRNYVIPILKNMHWFKLSVSIIIATFSSFWIKNIELSNIIILLLSSSVFFGIYMIMLIIFGETAEFKIHRTFQNNINVIWKQVNYKFGKMQK